jgi:hypothetical protein
LLPPESATHQITDGHICSSKHEPKSATKRAAYTRRVMVHFCTITGDYTMKRKSKKFTPVQLTKHLYDLTMNDTKFDHKFKPCVAEHNGTKFKVELENGQTFAITVKRCGQLI